MLSSLVRKRCSVQAPNGAPVESFVNPLICAVPLAVTAPALALKEVPEVLMPQPAAMDTAWMEAATEFPTRVTLAEPRRETVPGTEVIVLPVTAFEAEPDSVVLPTEDAALCPVTEMEAPPLSVVVPRVRASELPEALTVLMV